MIPSELIDKLGSCCLCGGPFGRNIWLIEKVGNGKGWGCFQCGLPCNGAVAVLCDDCAAEKSYDDSFTWRDLMHYTDGLERRPIAELYDAPDHRHDKSRHPELTAPPN